MCVCVMQAKSRTSVNALVKVIHFGVQTRSHTVGELFPVVIQGGWGLQQKIGIFIATFKSTLGRYKAPAICLPPEEYLAIFYSLCL